ncbi:NAD(P)-dependent oxidoreductase [Agromyces sp. NPDC049794]|uniref:NAD(P)-dependent oxidoreductase n=1 Tax=unclassified Agromyces TaxID=2639701 RepID=UPI003409F641
MNDALNLRVGFWGLGNMGAPMSRRLLDAGADVLGRDPSPAAQAAHVAAGGRVDADADLSELDILILMLPSSSVVESVLLDEGVASRLRAGTLVIDMSSSEPLRSLALARDLQQRGLEFMDAPVSGGLTGAEAGTLAIMAGGSEAAVQRAAGVMSILGRPRHVGAVGAGHALKALNNLLSATHLLVTSEAILVGERFGLDPAVMLETINASSGRSGSSQNKWPNFILPRTFDSGFGLRLMLKDMKIATELAHSLGIPMELGDAAVAEWSDAADSLDPDADHTEIARYLESRRDAGPGTGGSVIAVDVIG